MIDPFYVVLGAMVASPIAVPIFVIDTSRMTVLGGWRRPQPIVSLVCDLLAVEQGWSFRYHEFSHETGVVVEQKYDDHIRRLTVDGAEVPLRNADRLHLLRAVKRLEARRKSIASERAAAVLAERAQVFAARAERFADTVVPFEKRA